MKAVEVQFLIERIREKPGKKIELQEIRDKYPFIQIEAIIAKNKKDYFILEGETLSLNHEKLAPLEYIVSPIFTKHLATLQNVRGRVMKVLKTAKKGLNQSELEEKYFKRYLKTLEFPIQKITAGLISRKEIITEGTGEEIIFFHASYGSNEDELESTSDSKSEVTQKYVPRVDLSIMRQSKLSTDQSSSIIGNLLKKIDEKSRPISKSVIRVEEFLPLYKEGKEGNQIERSSTLPPFRKDFQKTEIQETVKEIFQKSKNNVSETPSWHLNDYKPKEVDVYVAALTTSEDPLKNMVERDQSTIVETLLRKIDDKNRSISKNEIQVKKQSRNDVEVTSSSDLKILSQMIPSPSPTQKVSRKNESKIKECIVSPFLSEDVQFRWDGSSSGGSEDQNELNRNFELKPTEKSSPIQHQSAANRNTRELSAAVFPSQPEAELLASLDFQLQTQNSALRKQSEEIDPWDSSSTVSAEDDNDFLDSKVEVVSPSTAAAIPSTSLLHRFPLENDKHLIRWPFDADHLKHIPGRVVALLKEAGEKIQATKVRSLYLQKYGESLNGLRDRKGGKVKLIRLLLCHKEIEKVKIKVGTKSRDFLCYKPSVSPLSVGAQRTDNAEPSKNIVERVLKLLKEAGSDGLDISGIQSRYFQKYGEELKGLQDRNRANIKLRKFLSHQKEIKSMGKIGGRRMYCCNFDETNPASVQLADNLISSVLPIRTPTSGKDENESSDMNSAPKGSPVQHLPVSNKNLVELSVVTSSSRQQHVHRGNPNSKTSIVPQELEGVDHWDSSSSASAEDDNDFLDSKVEVVPPSTAAATSTTSLLYQKPSEEDKHLIRWPFDADHLKHIPGRVAALLKEAKGEKLKITQIPSLYLQKYGESLKRKRLKDSNGRKIKLKSLLLCHKEIENFGRGNEKCFRYKPHVSSLPVGAQPTSTVASSVPLPEPKNVPRSIDIHTVQLGHRNAAVDELTSNSAVIPPPPPITLPTSTMGKGDLGEELCLLSFSISKNSFVRMNKGFSGNILANQRYTALDIDGFYERDRDYSLAQVSLGDGNSAILFDHQQGKEAVHRTLLNSFLNAKDLQYIFIHDCYQDVIALSSSFVEELYRNNKCFIDTQLVYEYFQHNFHCGFYSCLDFFIPNKEKHKMKDVVKDDPTYWLRRPLTLEQVQYAALDVILLQRAIPAILNKIKVAGEAAELDLLSVFLRATEKRITSVFEGLNRTMVFDNETFRPVSTELAEALSEFYPNSKYSRMVRKIDHPSLLKMFPVDNLSSAVPSKAISDSHERFNAAQIQIANFQQANIKLTSDLHCKNQECERLTAELSSVLQRLAEAESKTHNFDHYQLKLKTEEFAIKMNKIEHEVQELQKLRKADLNQFFINLSQIEDAINTIKCNSNDNANANVNVNVNDDKGDVSKLRPEEIQEVFHLHNALRNFIGSLKVQLKQKYDVITMTSQEFKPLETVNTAMAYSMNSTTQTTVPRNVSGGVDGNGVPNYYAFNALPGTFMLPHAAPAPSVQWFVPYNPAQVQVNPEFCALPGCRNRGLYTCAGCKKLSYCSVDHLRLHWVNHRLSCHP